MATGPQHYRTAERLREQADHWMDADTGWKAGLSTEERIAHRTADLLAAQVEATLALAAATAQSASVDGDPDSGMPPADLADWHAACGTHAPAKGTRS